MSDLFPVQEGGLEGYKFVIKIPVQFRDVDGMGHANNVAYFAFLETARLEYFVRLMELQDRAQTLSTMPFILGGQSISYRSPAYYRQILLVGVRTNWIRRSSFGFEYVMVEESSQNLVAEGSGTHVMYNYETSRSMPMPSEWVTRIEEFEGHKLQQ